jgi:transposase
VSPKRLAKTRTAKSVHDAGWSVLRNMLTYKSIATGGVMRVVPERYSSRTCSVCGCTIRIQIPAVGQEGPDARVFWRGTKAPRPRAGWMVARAPCSNVRTIRRVADITMI